MRRRPAAIHAKVRREVGWVLRLRTKRVIWPPSASAAMKMAVMTAKETREFSWIWAKARFHWIWTMKAVRPEMKARRSGVLKFSFRDWFAMVLGRDGRARGLGAEAAGAEALSRRAC